MKIINFRSLKWIFVVIMCALIIFSIVYFFLIYPKQKVYNIEEIIISEGIDKIAALKIFGKEEIKYLTPNEINYFEKELIKLKILNKKRKELLPIIEPFIKELLQRDELLWQEIEKIKNATSTI